MACPFVFINDTRLFLVNVLNRLFDSVELNFNVSVLLSCSLVLSWLFSLFLRLLSVLCLVSFISLVRALVAAVQSGKADVGVAGMTVTPDREKNVLFSQLSRSW